MVIQYIQTQHLKPQNYSNSSTPGCVAEKAIYTVC